MTLRTRNAITTELVKGVIDGVIAALHIHDGTRAIEMSGLLGGIMKVDPSELLTLLTAAPGDLREARNLFDVRGQIRPADDRLQYIDFRVDREPGPLALSAMIQRLEPIGR